MVTYHATPFFPSDVLTEAVPMANLPRHSLPAKYCEIIRTTCNMFHASFLNDYSNGVFHLLTKKKQVLPLNTDVLIKQNEYS